MDITDTAGSGLAELIKRSYRILVLTETCVTKRVPVHNSGIVLFKRENPNEPGPSFVGFELTGALLIADECRAKCAGPVTMVTLLNAVAEKRPAARVAIDEILIPLVEDRGINAVHI